MPTVVFAGLNRPLASTTTSSPASDFPPGSQVARGTLIRVPSWRLFALAQSQCLAHVCVCRCSRFLAAACRSRPFSGGSASGCIARQLCARAFVAAPRALGCPLASRLASPCCGVSCLCPDLWYAPGSDASGLAAEALSATLAGSMLAVPSAEAGTVSTAGIRGSPSFLCISTPRVRFPRVCVHTCAYKPICGLCVSS